MKPNLDKVRMLAKDLREEKPRPAFQELGGFQMAARTLDKCRATLLGWEGDFPFGCPMDREFMAEAELDPEEFKNFVATGANDKEVAEWIEEHAHARS
ncbi:MAG TPA: DUF5069 domain-containing protein [Clostridia bacterium]|nr:DUF5069 domain-containing protein [Clostridia bacterium]